MQVVGGQPHRELQDDQNSDGAKHLRGKHNFARDTYADTTLYSMPEMWVLLESHTGGGKHTCGTSAVRQIYLASSKTASIALPRDLKLCKRI